MTNRSAALKWTAFWLATMFAFAVTQMIFIPVVASVVAVVAIIWRGKGARGLTGWPRIILFVAFTAMYVPTAVMTVGGAAMIDMHCHQISEAECEKVGWMFPILGGTVLLYALASFVFFRPGKASALMRTAEPAGSSEA